MAWEKAHRPLGRRRGPVPQRVQRQVLPAVPRGPALCRRPGRGQTPAWPDPDPDCMEYLASRGVMTLDTDSASMGPLPDLAEPTHYAGLRHGMIWTESATGLGALPPTGAFYCMLSPEHEGGAFSEGRAFAIVGDPLAATARSNRPGRRTSRTCRSCCPRTCPSRGPARRGQPPPALLPDPLRPQPEHEDTIRDAHADSHAGTHLVPPAYALPPAGFDDTDLCPK